MPEELSQIVVQNLMMEDRREWDDEVLCDICNERDRNLIKKIPIPMRSREDSWFWIFDDKGVFTVKSCYQKIEEEANYGEAGFWRKLWSLKLPSKVLNFLWRTCRECLPTAAALITKNVQMSAICTWCQMYVEDSRHVLFNCDFARQVWSSVGLQDLTTLDPDMSIVQIFRHIFDKGTTDQFALVGLFCWGLWNRRNRWVWNHVGTSVFGVKAASLSLLSDWKKARESESVINMTQKTGSRSWVKPPVGWIKINIDASWGLQAGTVC